MQLAYLPGCPLWLRVLLTPLYTGLAVGLVILMACCFDMRLRSREG